MKKTIVLLLICVITFSAFKFVSEKNNATVDQKEGLYVFILSKPSAEYEYMGSVKKTLSWSGDPGEMLNTMIKKVKKEYPRAEGIIFTSVAMDRADAIQFKN